MQYLGFSFLTFLLSFSVSAPAPVTTEPVVSATNLVLQSDDGGRSWQDLSSGLPEDLRSARLVAANGALYLGSEQGFFKRSVMSPAPLWEKENFLDDRVVQIFPGQGSPFAASFTQGLFQRLPGTEMWISTFGSLKGQSVHCMLENADGSLLVGSGGGVLKSTDGGENWNKVFTGSVITSLVDQNGVLFASGPRGLWRSTDGGSNWGRILVEEQKNVRLKPVEGGLTAIVGQDWQSNDSSKVQKRHRLYFSSDKGKHWKRIDNGLPHTFNVYDLVQAGKHLFCSHDKGISRSSDGGKSWELVRRANENQVLDLTVWGKTLFVAIGGMFGC